MPTFLRIQFILSILSFRALPHHQHCAAFFQENNKLLDWVNQQPLDEPITCLGDGHPGVWNLIAGIASFDKRLEILDWYHRT